MIPTALTQLETDMLAALARDRKVYEAGALLGHSTLTLARTAKHVVSVDPHDGYPRRAPQSTWNQYRWNVRGTDNLQTVRARFEEHPPNGVAFAWMDLTGQYGLTREFLRLSDHVPIIGVHDYERSGCEGATRAVNEYIKLKNIWRIDRFDTLIVLHKNV